MSYDTWKTRVPDDHPSVEDEHGEGRCECCCDSCGDALVLHPDYGYLQCGDCHGGRSVGDTGDALRASMVAAQAVRR